MSSSSTKQIMNLLNENPEVDFAATSNKSLVYIPIDPSAAWKYRASVANVGNNLSVEYQ